MDSPKQNRTKSLLLAASIVLLVLASDQLSKELIRTKLNIGESIPAKDSFFSIYHTRNEGVAFSLLQDHPKVVLALQSTFLFIVALAFVYMLLKKHIGPMLTIPFSMIVSGGFGNLIDRIARGYVTDFFSVGSFPIFNIADIALTSGCGLFVLFVILEELKAKKKANV